MIFAISTNKKIIQYVIDQLLTPSISDTLSKLVSERYSDGVNRKYAQGCFSWQYYAILSMLVFNREVDNLELLDKTINNEDAFCNGIFCKDGWNDNAINAGIEQKKLASIQYIFDKDRIKQRLIDDKDELHGVMVKLNGHFDESIAKTIVKSLDLTKDKINELKEHKEFDTTQILRVIN